MKFIATLGLVFCLLPIRGARAGSSLTDDVLLQVKFDQKVGGQVPLNLPFRDATARTVSLKDYFHGQPVILIMGYYGCPMLCTLVLNGVLGNLRELPRDGLQYQVIFAGIDPTETPALAAEKKKMYARGYAGRPEDWHFLTGDESSIRALADAIGFRYVYDTEAKQFAHPSGFVVLTPDGEISRYFSGATFSAKELSEALREAVAGKTREEPSALSLLCFHYAPLHGKYGKLALNTVRAGGLATIVALGCVLVLRKNKPGRRE